jgi:hypothetical protein
MNLGRKIDCTKALRGLLQSLKAKVVMVPEIWALPFPSTSLTIHYSLSPIYISRFELSTSRLYVLVTSTYSMLQSTRASLNKL